MIENTLENQTIKVYKLFDLSVTETEPKKYAYQVNEYFKDAIATALGISTTTGHYAYTVNESI